MKTIAYDEPGRYFNLTIRISEKRAIRLQREYSVKKYGYDIYDSDWLALDDYKLLHGAWEECEV